MRRFFERIVGLQILLGGVVRNAGLWQIQHPKVRDHSEDPPDLLYLMRAPRRQHEVHQEIPSAAF